jgi:hypothetical protein
MNDWILTNNDVSPSQMILPSKQVFNFLEKSEIKTPKQRNIFGGKNMKSAFNQKTSLQQHNNCYNI